MSITMEYLDANKDFTAIQLDRSAIYRGELILINSEFPLRTARTDLIRVPKRLIHPVESARTAMYVDRTCMRQLQALLTACRARGNILLVSGYRSNTEQHMLYETTMKERGEQFTKSFVAKPNESEHQSGLAVDVGENSGDIDFICPTFSDRGASGDFKKLAAQFGFIQRYTASKSNITKIANEPWHYRYVGYPHAAIMEQEQLCLEEYISYVKNYEVNGRHLFFEQEDCVYEIYYAAATERTTIIPITNPEYFTVSGNNVDGFIITTVHPKHG
ncbi:D-alanyl-D-alanine carboxypeptidase family protein [Paenibacillus yanchengensis]|uniref:D-alanyl-D-alanine carboxypeptidase family protein n=1 Tax=Paenibacillus yanchengensis TaxID=2035833 RepID=A0ABW4YKT6_9BACL